MKPGNREYEIFRYLDEGGWEIGVRNFRLEDIPKWGKTVFGTREEAERPMKPHRNGESKA